MRILVLLGQMRRGFLGRFSKQAILLLNELCLISLVVNIPYAILFPRHHMHTAQPIGHTIFRRSKNLKLYMYECKLCTKFLIEDICIVYGIMQSKNHILSMRLGYHIYVSGL